MNVSDRKQEFYDHLYNQSTSVKQWVAQHNFDYETTIQLLNGRNKGIRGKSRQVRLAIEQELANINA